MNRKAWSILLYSVLVIAVACSRNRPAQKVVVEIPSGFNGDFLLEMGVKGAPPLIKQGDTYLVAVPRSGKAITSTLLTNSQPSFRNSSEGAVWGYSHSVFNTGDGIPIGGKIELFVGTKKDFEAEQGKRNHSEGFSHPPSAPVA
jgi:hypothetical protein